MRDASDAGWRRKRSDRIGADPQRVERVGISLPLVREVLRDGVLAQHAVHRPFKGSCRESVPKAHDRACRRKKQGPAVDDDVPRADGSGVPGGELRFEALKPCHHRSPVGHPGAEVCEPVSAFGEQRNEKSR